MCWRRKPSRVDSPAWFMSFVVEEMGENLKTSKDKNKKLEEDCEQLQEENLVMLHNQDSLKVQLDQMQKEKDEMGKVKEQMERERDAALKYGDLWKKNSMRMVANMCCEQMGKDDTLEDSPLMVTVCMQGLLSPEEFRWSFYSFYGVKVSSPATANVPPPPAAETRRPTTNVVRATFVPPPPPTTNVVRGTHVGAPIRGPSVVTPNVATGVGPMRRAQRDMTSLLSPAFNERDYTQKKKSVLI